MTYPQGTAALAISIALGEQGVIEEPENITKYGKFMKAEKNAAAYATRLAVVEAANAQRQVLLNRLGITEDEAKLLLS